MRFKFKSSKLEALYTAEKGAHKYPPEVVEAFFEVMAIIASAGDERDLYAIKSLHFEKLAGNRAGERSVRLTKQWRLTLTIEEDDEGHYLLILDILDYHR